MNVELKQALDEIDAQIRKYAALNNEIDAIKSDREKYAAEVDTIESMDYTDIDIKVINKLTVLRTRLELIPNMLEQKENQLKLLDSNFPASITGCSQILELIVEKYAAEKSAAMVAALIKLGTPEAEAVRTVGENQHLLKLRSLYYQGQGYGPPMKDYNSGIRVLNVLRPIADEALKESPDFDQFVSA